MTASRKDTRVRRTARKAPTFRARWEGMARGVGLPPGQLAVLRELAYRQGPELVWDRPVNQATAARSVGASTRTAKRAMRAARARGLLTYRVVRYVDRDAGGWRSRIVDLRFWTAARGRSRRSWSDRGHRVPYRERFQTFPLHRQTVGATKRARPPTCRTCQGDTWIYVDDELAPCPGCRQT